MECKTLSLFVVKPKVKPKIKTNTKTKTMAKLESKGLSLEIKKKLDDFYAKRFLRHQGNKYN